MEQMPRHWGMSLYLILGFSLRSVPKRIVKSAGACSLLSCPKHCEHPQAETTVPGIAHLLLLLFIVNKPCKVNLVLLLFGNCHALKKYYYGKLWLYHTTSCLPGRLINGYCPYISLEQHWIFCLYMSRFKWIVRNSSNTLVVDKCLR